MGNLATQVKENFCVNPPCADDLTNSNCTVDVTGLDSAADLTNKSDPENKSFTAPSTRSRTVRPQRGGLMSMHIPCPGTSTSVARSMVSNVLRKNTKHEFHGVGSVTECVVPPEPKRTKPTGTVATSLRAASENLTQSQSKGGTLLRVVGRLYQGCNLSDPLSVLIDTGFSGRVLLSAKQARKMKLHLSDCDNPIRLADGTLVRSSTIAMDMAFSLGEDHVERCDIPVFPLSAYDMVLGMQWLQEHSAHIMCSDMLITFTHDHRTFKMVGSDVSCMDLGLMGAIKTDDGNIPLQLLTCNQLKSMVKDPEVETMAVFLLQSKDDVVYFTSEGDVQKAGKLYSMESAVTSLRTKLAHLPESTRNQFTSMLEEYKDTVFADREYCSVDAALRRDVQLEINEIPDQPHPCKNVYRLSPPMLEELRKQLRALLAGGIIRPSTSPYGAPVLFARKKGGEWRMCIDYRALNKITIKDKYPLPRADDLFDQLHGAKFFTKIDLRWGYHQVKIRPEDVHKTAFRSPLGSFEWVCMPFGLTNAPATFQRFVQHVLRDFLGEFACVYIDDILVYSKTAEDHVHHVRQVLEQLKQHQLLAKPSKCEFFAQEVEYLGHIVTSEGIKVDESKIRVIQDWPVLQKQRYDRSWGWQITIVVSYLISAR